MIILHLLCGSLDPSIQSTGVFGFTFRALFEIVAGPRGSKQLNKSLAELVAVLFPPPVSLKVDISSPFPASIMVRALWVLSNSLRANPGIAGTCIGLSFRTLLRDQRGPTLVMIPAFILVAAGIWAVKYLDSGRYE
jgi:hypothetical protein